jgi:hypothetical protein
MKLLLDFVITFGTECTQLMVNFGAEIIDFRFCCEGFLRRKLHSFLKIFKSVKQKN